MSFSCDAVDWKNGRRRRNIQFQKMDKATNINVEHVAAVYTTYLLV